MDKKLKEGDLSSKISSIINTAPDYGEEDDDFTKFHQKTCEEAFSDSGDELNLAQFRKINIELLDAEDEKYAGVRSSRKRIVKEKAFGSESEESDVDVDTGSVKSDAQDDGSDGFEDDLEETEELDADESVSEVDGSDDGGGEEDSSDESSESEEDTEKSDQEDDGDDSNFHELSAKVASDVEKGHGIRNQFSLWDSLLECRIKFQKCLTMANKLPQKTKMDEFLAAGADEIKEAQKSCQNSVKKVLNSLLDLQNTCLEINTEQLEEFKSGKRTVDDDDDEIVSSEDSDIEDRPSTSGFHKQRKRMKLEDISEEIKDLHETLIPFRNATIQKWNDKTKITQMGSKNFSAFEQSTMKQIESVLADKQRLLKRTRTKRSNYHILGELDEGPSAKLQKTDECSEIYDDDDFYHQLLRELLERKSSDTTDPVQLSRQWIELQKARNKMKRQVDQSASKGRKLRYDVHQKLVNFMMPIDNTTWTEEARAELFSSIFGEKPT